MPRIPRSDDCNIVGIQKGHEVYLVKYEDHQKADALRQIGRWASEPELSFSWADAAVLAARVRENPNQTA